jgi:hypothetical protein
MVSSRAAMPLHCALLRLFAIAAIAANTLLAGCAAPLDSFPAHFAPVDVGSSRPAELAVIAPAVVRPSHGRRRLVEAGSLWQAVGRVEQGDVYKRVNGIFIVQARDIHEAYLVVSNGMVVGFYLAAEGTFSPATPPVPLTLKGNS